ncbi:hypothetical protein BJY52DRAFT_1190302 [Lactarius psammicola]|nr:hypothetical protein BJY52DRAFT_1190302 [Lactarius psammicola]
MASFTKLLQDRMIRGENARSGPEPQRLEKTLDASKTGAMSSTIAFSEGVDLESIRSRSIRRRNTGSTARASTPRLTLIDDDDMCFKQSYEEMFMKINPLQAVAAPGSKSKDIYLPSFDVSFQSFGSNRILRISPGSCLTWLLTSGSSGASLTLAYDRRFGIIGRNGVRKSTLLRHIATREVPILPHITILFVEQEVIGDDTTALNSVLKADGETHLNARLAELDGTPPGELDVPVDEAKDEVSGSARGSACKLGRDGGREWAVRAAAFLADGWVIAPRLGRLHRLSNYDQVSGLAKRIKSLTVNNIRAKP